MQAQAGDFGNFVKVGVIGKCILICIVHHNSPILLSESWINADSRITRINDAIDNPDRIGISLTLNGHKNAQ